MEKNFLVMLIIIFSIDLYAQKNNEIVAASPTVAELGKYGLVPVGLFSGTAQYNIPLYELKTKNLSVPISLSYSTNGLVVDQVSTWVGHSWSLNAGGVITRNVRGLPDDPTYSKPYPDYADGVNFNPTLLYNFLYENRFHLDVEPDIYAFNFLGYQGKFFIDTDNKVYMTPYENLKIEVGPNSTFIITTPDGVKFTFSIGEINYCSYGACSDYSQFYGAWNLTKIEHPAGDIINFYYSDSKMLEYNSGISENIERKISTDGNCSQANLGSDPMDGGIRASNSSTLTSHLDSITTNGSGSIKFQSSKNIKDRVDDYNLDLITIFNNEHAPIKSFSFDYIFPAANTNYNPLPSAITYTLTSEHTTELNYRMYLNQLTINNLQDNKNQVFSFEYNNLDNLPRRLSLAQDYFGYFNGVTNNYHFVPSELIPSYYLPYFSGITGNRHPNGTSSINGTLKKITYPTGGFTKIYYQPHQSTIGEIGGCRVQKTESYDNINQVPNVKEYNYCDGILYGLPTSFRTYDIIKFTPPGSCAQCNTHYAIITSGNIYSINHNGQYPVVYGSVSVSDGINFQNGGTYYGFKVDTDIPAMILPYTAGIVYPLPKGNQGWSNGTKESEETKKRLDNGNLVTVKREAFHYNYTELRGQKIRYCLSRYINGNWSGPCVYPDPYVLLQGYNVVKYPLVSQWCPLTSKTTTIYDTNGQNPFETSIFYTYGNDYDPIHAQVTKEETTDSKGIKQIKTYKYSTDYEAAPLPPVSTCESEKQTCINTATTKRDQTLATCNTITNQSAKATCISACTSTYNYEIGQCQSNFTICQNNYNNSIQSDQRVITEMKTKNMISAVIEEQSIQTTPNNTTTITGGTINKFTKQNGLIVPSEVYSLEINSPSTILDLSTFNSSGSLITPADYFKKLTYDKYDTKGNILQYHKSDDINTAFLWSYNGSMPVIKGDNVTYDILNAAVIAAGAANLETFFSGLNNIATDATQQTTWKNFNTALRSNASLANAQVTTYTYSPLVGMTSQTDPNGITTYFEYDSFGRLKNVKDKDQNILKSNLYHYYNN